MSAAHLETILECYTHTLARTQRGIEIINGVCVLVLPVVSAPDALVYSNLTLTASVDSRPANECVCHILASGIRIQAYTPVVDTHTHADTHTHTH